MDIRRSTRADLMALGQLLTELGYPASSDEIDARMTVIGRADFATFVAELDGDVAGMIIVSVSPSPLRNDPNGAILVLVVSSAFRGRGIAPALIAECEAWLRRQGASRATVTQVFTANPPIGSTTDWAMSTLGCA